MTPRRTCLVTGGGTGIGAATARLLAARGWHVAVNGRRAEPLAAVAAETGGVALPGDTSHAGVAGEVVAAAVDRLGGLDALVLSAGSGRSGDVLEQTAESFAEVLRTNVEGPFHLMRAALPHLVERRGAIVTVASLAGLRVAGASAAYCTSKAAAIMLTRTVAVDFGPRGVRANVVCPAWTRTDMADRAMDALAELRGSDREEAYAAANRYVPLRRPATAEEAAAAVAWLVSEEASYVNGAVLTTDGGLSLVDAGGIAFTDAAG